MPFCPAIRCFPLCLLYRYTVCRHRNDVAPSQRRKDSFCKRIVILSQNPPTWSLSPKAKAAAWVLKQRVRQDLGLNARTPKDRRKKAQNSHSNSGNGGAQVDGTVDPSEEATPLVDKDDLKPKSRNLAVIAAGYGSGPEAKAVRRRQRRRLASALTVGMVAVVHGVAYQQCQSEPPPRAAKKLFFTDDTSPTTKDSSIKSTSESNKVMSTSSVSSELSFPSILEYCKNGSAFLLSNESHDKDCVEPKAYKTLESKASSAARSNIVPTIDAQKTTGPPSIRATEDDTKAVFSKLVTPTASGALTTASYHDVHQQGCDRVYLPLHLSSSVALLCETYREQ
jgi:hypothetical protein